MKFAACILALGSILSVAALAEGLTAKTETFTCLVDVHTKTYDLTGKEVFDAAYSGKSSEGTRTTWTEGATTYRFSDTAYYAFSKVGDAEWTNELRANAKVYSKMVKAEQEGLIVYAGETKTVGVSVRKSDENKISETNSIFQETYAKVGEQEVLVKSVYEGKEEPVWVSDVRETQVDENTRVVTETFQTPHYGYDKESKTTYVDLKNVKTCTYVKIAE